MNSHVIIICRSGSKRLKKKSLIKYKKKSVLEYLVDNILSAGFKRNKIIICTTKLKEDNSLVKISKKNKLNIIRGSSKDIVSRVITAFKKFKINKAFITSGDNPFFLEDLSKKICKQENFDTFYTENLPVGLNLICCSKKGIKKISEQYLTKNNEDGFYLYFTKINLISKKIKIPIPQSFKKSRFTIDYFEDFEFFKKIINLLDKKTVSLLNLKNILKKNPQLIKINRHRNNFYKKNLKKKVKLFYKDNYDIIKKIKYR